MEEVTSPMESVKGLKNKSKRASLSSNEKEVASNSLWQCQQCTDVFPTALARKRHEKYNHVVSKPYQCECGQQFGKLSEVNYHIRRIHNQEKNYICPKCSKAFFKNSDLVSHLSTHDSYGKFLCKECGRRFKHVSNLIRHSRTHTGVKPYPCSLCNKRFSQIAALRQHQITEEHKIKATESLKNESVASIENSDDIHEADLSVIVDDNDDTEIKKEPKRSSKESARNHKWWFYCKVCGERFQFSVLLRDHEIKHDLNRDVTCNSCGKHFLSVKDLKNHACQLDEDFLKKNASISDASTNEKEMLINAQLQDLTSDELSGNHIVSDEINTVDFSKPPHGNDKKVEVTLSQNGQIMLDNDEVLLTLNDKVYGLLLINNDVTILESDENFPVMNQTKISDFYMENEVDASNPNKRDESVFDLNSQPLEKDLNGTLVSNDKFVIMDNWLWNEKSCFTETPDIPETEKPVADAKSVDKGNDRPDVQSGKLKKKKPMKTYSCSECKKIFNKKGNYEQHLGTHSVNLQKYKCPECNRNFAWKSTLRKHEVKEHGEKTQYLCQQCGKSYQSSILVQHHFKRDHMNIRTNVCNYCGKSFFRRYDLKIHVRIHTNERPYVCGHCGKTFRHLSHNIRHEKTHLKEQVR